MCFEERETLVLGGALRRSKIPTRCLQAYLSKFEQRYLDNYVLLATKLYMRMKYAFNYQRTWQGGDDAFSNDIAVSAC